MSTKTRAWRWIGLGAVALGSWACGVTGPLASDDDGGAGGPSGTGTGAGDPGSTGPGAGTGGTTASSGDTSSSASAGGAGGGLPTPQVAWISWPSQQSRGGAAWGSALTDIANHLPASYGSTYDDPDLVTFGHETSHGIHAHLRNYQNNTGARANAFYVLGDKAALVKEPDIRKSEVVPYVPASLRDFRFGTYVSGAPSWDDTPLYIWDEWNAYVNGAEVGVSRVEEGLWSEGWRDQSGNFEFVVYAMAVAHAVSELDPTYFEEHLQFREFLQWNTERAMALFEKHQSMSEFTSQSVGSYFTKFQTAADAEGLRQFIRDTFGAAWASQLLGI